MPILEVKAAPGRSIAFFNVFFPVIYVLLEFKVFLWVRIVFLHITVGNRYYSLPCNINSLSPLGKTTEALLGLPIKACKGLWAYQFDHASMTLQNAMQYRSGNKNNSLRLLYSFLVTEGEVNWHSARNQNAMITLIHLRGFTKWITTLYCWQNVLNNH